MTLRIDPVCVGHSRAGYGRPDSGAGASHGDMWHAPTAESDAIDAVLTEIQSEVFASYAPTKPPAHRNPLSFATLLKESITLSELPTPTWSPSSDGYHPMHDTTNLREEHRVANDRPVRRVH